MKKIMLIAIILLVSACASTSKNTERFYGVWEGAGIQDNKTSWTIKLTVAGGKYSIDYPSLGCGGELTLLYSSIDKLAFREKLTYGKTKCIDKGKTVIIKTGQNSAQYQWSSSNSNTKATGTLKR